MHTENIFIPRQQQTKAPVQTPHQDDSMDAVSKVLYVVGQWLVVLLGGLIPIFFLPGVPTLLGVNKFLVVAGVALTVLFIQVVLMARQKSVKALLPLSLIFFLGFVIVSFVSAVLSGDVNDSVFGNGFEVHTSAFATIMLLLLFTPLILQGSKRMMLQFMTLFGLASIAVLVHAVTRIFFGPELLSFGAFTVATQSLVGGFNDLAIFAGLTIVLGLITLLLLPLRLVLQGVIALLIAIALLVQVVVDFTHVWGLLIFSSLLAFLFVVSQNRLFVVKGKGEKKITVPTIVAVMSLLTFVVSGFFLIAGESITKNLNDQTNTSYVEVRPSLSATTDILAASYKDEPWLGVGPNRFADAWRQYKSKTINQTIFWDTDFNGGYAFVPTLFITHGLVGGVLFILFNLCYIYFGFRLLTSSTKQDSFWHAVAVMSFVASLYLWTVLYIFVPSAALMFLAALFSGITFATAPALLTDKTVVIPLNTDKQRGIILLGVAILVSLAIAAATYVTVDRYDTAVRLSEGDISSSNIPADDKFHAALAAKAFARMQELAVTTNPTEENRQGFFEASKEALQNGERAIELDATEPTHYAALAEIYANLAAAGVEGALVSAEEALEKARALDPMNPKYLHASAELAWRLGDRGQARAYIEEALTLKNNYTEAMVLLIQIDIDEGNVAKAIETTQSIIRLEPNNPTRYFQLGVLLSSQGNADAAEALYLQALAIDPFYANARYLLALLMVQRGAVEEALSELYIVRETNQNNEQLNLLISRLESGESIDDIVELANLAVRREVPVVDSFNDAVTAPVNEDSDLVVPVNQEFAPEEPSTGE